MTDLSLECAPRDEPDAKGRHEVPELLVHSIGSKTSHDSGTRGEEQKGKRERDPPVEQSCAPGL